MSESSDDSAPTAPAKGGKLITILAVVNFLSVLGVGGYLVYTQQHAAAQSKSTKGNEHADAKSGHGAPAAKTGHGEEAAEDPEHGEAEEGEHGQAAGGHGGEEEEAETHFSGPLLPLESMVTNLAEPDSDRYLKATMQLRIKSESAKPEVEAHIVPIRNQILLYLSSLTIADLSGAENKRAIQKRVKRIANEAMPSSRVTQVYFTEFVIQ